VIIGTTETRMMAMRMTSMLFFTNGTEPSKYPRTVTPQAHSTAPRPL